MDYLYIPWVGSWKCSLESIKLCKYRLNFIKMVYDIYLFMYLILVVFTRLQLILDLIVLAEELIYW